MIEIFMERNSGRNGAYEFLLNTENSFAAIFNSNVSPYGNCDKRKHNAQQNTSKYLPHMKMY